MTCARCTARRQRAVGGEPARSRRPQPSPRRASRASTRSADRGATSARGRGGRAAGLVGLPAEATRPARQKEASGSASSCKAKQAEASGLLPDEKVVARRFASLRTVDGHAGHRVHHQSRSRAEGQPLRQGHHPRWPRPPLPGAIALDETLGPEPHHRRSCAPSGIDRRQRASVKQTAPWPRAAAIRARSFTSSSSCRQSMTTIEKMRSEEVLCPRARFPILLPSSAWAESNRFALVIGANSGDKDDATLRYADSDARRVAQVLRDLAGYDTENITILDRAPKSTPRTCDARSSARTRSSANAVAMFRCCSSTTRGTPTPKRCTSAPRTCR